MRHPTPNSFPDLSPGDTVAVLASGGIDSAVLIGELSDHVAGVMPIYVRFGLQWEMEEEAALRRFLQRLDSDRVAALRTFELPLGEVYDEHWSLTGVDVPGWQTADEAVSLPGRNLFQLLQPAVWCHLNGVRHLALATLRNNPFADATPQFFTLLEQTINRALAGELRILRPYESLSKRDVLLRGRGLPLEATMSCLRPVDGVHCGACNKCAERRKAFALADLPDPTLYEWECVGG
jgi:7-cyano-7-deazaguanine synthase